MTKNPTRTVSVIRFHNNPPSQVTTNPKLQIKPKPKLNQLPTTSKMPNYVKPDQLEPSKVVGKELEIKEVKGEKGKSYMQIPLKYNYGHMEDAFRMQLPKVQCSGIKPNKYRPDTFVINVRFDRTNEMCQMFMERFPQVFQSTCEILYTQRMAAKMKFFDPKVPEASKFRNPLFYPPDPKTNEPQLDQDPFMQIKLIRAGTPPNEMKSLFTDLKKKEIDWDLLKNVSLTLIPLISLEKIYLGSNPSLQIKLISAVVCGVRKHGKETMQEDAINDYLLEHPNADNELEEQLTALMAQNTNAANQSGRQSPSAGALPQGSNSSGTSAGSSSAIPMVPTTLSQISGPDSSKDQMRSFLEGGKPPAPSVSDSGQAPSITIPPPMKLSIPGAMSRLNVGAGQNLTHN